VSVASVTPGGGPCCRRAARTAGPPGARRHGRPQIACGEIPGSEDPSQCAAQAASRGLSEHEEEEEEVQGSPGLLQNRWRTAL